MSDDRTDSELYDAFYFAHYCGRPYQRDKEWLDFFGSIADRIVSDIQPKSVLDAGCAMGFLVEALRERGVEAYGIDVSEFAIGQVHEDVKEYCWVGSVTEPLPQSYDLIVCIEVLEHLQPEDAQQALVNLCQQTDDILFSSTPFDYKEVTHFNVKTPEHWAEMLAREGFFRDVDFDASFITPWAVRARRRSEPLARMIREYERKYWLLWKENTDLRSLTTEMRGELAQKVREQSSMRELLREKQRIQGDLAEIEANVAWRIVVRAQRLRTRMFPLGGRRDRIWNTGVVFLRAWLNIGLRGAMTKAVAKLRGRPLGQTPQADYVRWIKSTEPSSSELADQRAAADDLGYRPLISVLTPVYNPQPSVLQAALDSVFNQTYDNWELCLVDGNSEDPEVRKVLRSHASEDERVKVRMLESNAGISGNSQRALEMAEGEFIALMDHDDVLAPNALFEAVEALNHDPEIDVLYCDEDKLSEDGKVRRDPWFKPDWSPNLLLSANYLMHSVMRRELVESVGGFDITMDGAQDWDLVMRCTEKTDAIRHIPKVLYHWRQVEGSAASDLLAKPWVFENQLRCVQAHLKRRGIEQVRALFDSPGFLRVEWPAKGSKVSIIILNKDKVEVLSRCITSIKLLTEYQNYEILVVDSSSSEERTRDFYRSLEAESSVRIVEFPGEFNFSAANNLGAQRADGDMLLFLNNDTEVLDPDWLEEMVRWAELPEIGAVGAKLLYPNDRIQHAGVIIGMQGHASHVFWNSLEKQTGPFGSVDWHRDYMAVTGACVMIPREVFEEVGGFDEGYRIAFSDVELCVRVWKSGYRVVYNPFVRLRHYEGQSRGSYIPAEDILRGLEQLQDLVRAGDPYFNPNLSYEVRIPSIVLKGEESREARLTRLAEQHAEGFGKQPSLEA